MPQHTLIEFAEAEEEGYGDLVDEAGADLAEAREDLSDGRDRLRSHSDTLSGARETAESLRSRLAEVPTPGDGEELLEDLAQALMEAREAMRDVHRTRTEIREAGVRREAAAARREAAERQLREAEEALEEARAEKEVRDRWIQRLGEAPFDTLKGDAEDLRDGSDLSDLADDLEAAIPEKLRQAALRRRALELLRRTHARKLVALARDLLDEVNRDPAAEETGFRRARSALGEYVRDAADALATARTFLEGRVPEIGEGEEDDLQELAADGAVSANLEIALTDARIEVEKRRFELREAKLGALADPSQDPSVVSDAEDALATAESDRDDALSDYEDESEDHPRHLERWELALPDEVWRFFLRFHEISDSLDRLAALDPDELKSDLEDAEEALAGARREAAEQRRRRHELSLQHQALEEHRRGMEEVFDARMFSAIRGDG